MHVCMCVVFVCRDGYITALPSASHKPGVQTSLPAWKERHELRATTSEGCEDVQNKERFIRRGGKASILYLANKITAIKAVSWKAMLRYTKYN